MNPAKRKKLLSLELAQKNQEVVQPQIVQEKLQLETSKQIVEQATTLETSTLEMGLKLSEENKKDKKKKTTSQDV